MTDARDVSAKVALFNSLIFVNEERHLLVEVVSLCCIGLTKSQGTESSGALVRVEAVLICPLLFKFASLATRRISAFKFDYLNVYKKFMHIHDQHTVF